jgi:hypothetical protein
METNEIHCMIFLYWKNSPDQHTFSKFTHKHFVKNPSFFHMKKQYFALNLTF